jgi:hypothetical protein
VKASFEQTIRIAMVNLHWTHLQAGNSMGLDEKNPPHGSSKWVKGR